MEPLSERKSRILQIIVDGYVHTASPVASSFVARSRKLRVSAATVRNEMGALEEDGFIMRPHISAGGIPSDKGYRHFVEALDPARALNSRDEDLVESELQSSAEDVDEWANAASTVLSALLNTVAFATPLRARSSFVKSIELLALQEMLVMLVVVMREAAVYRQLINVEESIAPSQLESSRNRVNALIAGKTFAGLDQQSAELEDGFDRQVMMSTMDVMRKHESRALRDRSVQGVSLLLGQPEFRDDAEKAHRATSALESDDVFARFVRAAPENSVPAVMIGVENQDANMRDLSVVVCQYGIDGEAHGLVGVMAPTRMEYERAIPLVAHAGGSLAGLAARVYG